MINQYIKGKVLVIIDAANLESALKDLGWRVDYKKLRELFGENLIETRDYCVHHGTENQNKFFSFLKNNGFTLITKPLKIIKIEDIQRGDIRKANFDVEIAVDVMEMTNRFETLVLFSGDSDFNYLLRNLKKKNKKIIVISTTKHVAKELIESCDKYIDLKKIQQQVERKKQ